MSVDEMIEWLESAKRESAKSGQDISNYPVIHETPPIEEWGLAPLEQQTIGLKVDHGRSVVCIRKEQM